MMCVLAVSVAMLGGVGIMALVFCAFRDVREAKRINAHYAKNDGTPYERETS